MTGRDETIPALTPQNETGWQFVVYGDSCSGVPGAPHEATLAAVNAVVKRLRPQPQFICFPGDEIRGLTADVELLREQWDYWFRHEMAWLDQLSIPLYHTTGNHTTYDAVSETVFREVLSHLPQNGPDGQRGLSYFVRRDDLLIVFVNTMWSELGGEGRVETEWLHQTLADHANVRYKLVIGHHPVHPVNGFSGDYQRVIESKNGQRFWRMLVQHRVLAYVCSHILAFDVQVHDGVLQILTAGAGTAHRMPEDVEYLHCVQAALDANGLRYQVLDTSGEIREWLSWPLVLPPSESWAEFSPVDCPISVQDQTADWPIYACLSIWKITGRCAQSASGAPQTLVCGWNHDQSLAPFWLGLQGSENRTSALLCHAPERSPHLWLGPELTPGDPFELQVGVHSGMGPGGLLWRWNDESPWSSLIGASAWGAERVRRPQFWSVGHGSSGPADRAFRGENLRVSWHDQILQLQPSRTLRPKSLWRN
ncbi:MAG: metallophosphoesterase [Planctomycetes bacterium]|nr:metallophosphoesterase [Planctomycetota bacterium]MBL7043985.1 metallophosphoesterase [Pirellulaceae bacterium]